MADRPILFSGPMVRAILDGKKTQTRRVVRTDDQGRIVRGRYAAFMRDNIGLVWRPFGGSDEVQMPADRVWEFVGYAPGDRLWVRETWKRDGADSIAAATTDFEDAMGPQLGPTFYAADNHPMGPSRYWPSIHMPRWASRLTLTVTDVRVHRLQDISEEDAVAEGVDAISMADVKRQSAWSRRHDFAQLWDSINGKREGANWDANPWVVAVSFAAEKRNIDADTDPAYTARLIGAASLDPL